MGLLAVCTVFLLWHHSRKNCLPFRDFSFSDFITNILLMTSAITKFLKIHQNTMQFNIQFAILKIQLKFGTKLETSQKTEVEQSTSVLQLCSLLTSPATFSLLTSGYLSRPPFCLLTKTPSANTNTGLGSRSPCESHLFW